MRYSIEGQELTDIADALRRKHGETEVVTATVYTAVQKTPNATSHDSFGKYTSGAIDSAIPVTFTNAKNITVIISCNTTSAAKVYITSGNYSVDNYPVNDQNTIDLQTCTRQILTFENTDTVTFYVSFSRYVGNLSGFYADVIGFDENGNSIQELGTSEIETEIEVKKTFQSNEMAQAIDDLPQPPPAEAYAFSGDCSYKFYNGSWDWFIERYVDKITITELTNAMSMFDRSNTATIPPMIEFKNGGGDCDSMFCFCGEVRYIPSIDFKQTSYKRSGSMFRACKKITEIGDIKNLYPSDMNNMFVDCHNLRYVPNFVNLNLSQINTYAYSNCGSMFSYCYSLRRVPEDFLKGMYGIQSTSYSFFSLLFHNCYSLDEAIGLNPQSATLSSNVFGSYNSGTFTNCSRLKNIIFAKQDDGTPYKVNWRSQSINLSTYIGYFKDAIQFRYILDYNSGITADKEVTDDATYQALKDDPDWFTCNVAYSRYNHDSAVATLNSLPDASAYIAANGGTNTIKFNGAAGELTDGGAINTLTAEEIAVATAKGWTVSFA